jgi:hypothetical protein
MPVVYWLFSCTWRNSCYEVSKWMSQRGCKLYLKYFQMNLNYIRADVNILELSSRIGYFNSLKRIFKPIWRISMESYKYMWCFIYSFFSRSGWCRARYPILMHNGSTGRSEIECKPNLKNVHTYLKIIQSVFGVLERTFTSSCRSSIGCFHARDVILAMKKAK